MDSGYSRHSQFARIVQPVAIISVNPTASPPQATGITRTREYIQIDISHYVGAVQVTPAVGEQWMVSRDRSIWKLEQQLPYNDPNTLEIAKEGQTRIGSSGPTDLSGSHLNIKAPEFASKTTNFNVDTTNLNITASECKIAANQLNVDAPIRPLTTTTESRPDPGSVPAGSNVFDTDINQPVWSNGTNWINANGLERYAVQTVDRPDASSVPAGTNIFDTTLGKPLWSDGITWQEAGRILAVTTSNRPAAGVSPAGTAIFDTTLKKPLWSDGTNWRDAAGSIA